MGKLLACVEFVAWNLALKPSDIHVIQETNRLQDFA
jgi:hypothetical protein